MDESDKKGCLIFFALLGVVVFYFVAIGFLPYLLHKDPANAGTFGDSFGFINSLFSALAFAGVVYAIYLQTNELKAQRQELETSRKAFENQVRLSILASLFDYSKRQLDHYDPISDRDNICSVRFYEAVNLQQHVVKYLLGDAGELIRDLNLPDQVSNVDRLLQLASLVDAYPGLLKVLERVQQGASGTWDVKEKDIDRINTDCKKLVEFCESNSWIFEEKECREKLEKVVSSSEQFKVKDLDSVKQLSSTLRELQPVLTYKLNEYYEVVD